MAARRTTSKKDHLKVVSTDKPEATEPEKPEKPKNPPTLAEAVAGGNYLEILLAQQREIASTVGQEKGPAKAALHRQLAALSAEIERLREAARIEAEENGGAGEVPDEAFDATAL